MYIVEDPAARFVMYDRPLVNFGDWYGRSNRIQNALNSPGVRELLTLIKRKGGRITTSELMHASRKHRPTSVAQAVLNDLATAELGSWQVTATRGRSRREFVLPVSPNVTGS